jgi:uncharacterized membrane protein YdfJ with MMPL/SSD domain
MAAGAFLARSVVAAGRAVAVARTAVGVRPLLDPVALRLTGRWAWWRPTWLARVVPDVNFGA